MKRTSIAVFGSMLMLAMLMPGTPAVAQTVVIQIGGVGYSGLFNNPFDMYYPDSREQHVYRMPDITAAFAAAGIPVGPVYIKSISYQSSYWYGGADPLYEDLGIKMGTTTEDWNTWAGNNSPFIATNWTQVFTNKPYTFNPTLNAWQKFNFDNIFYWDGTKNMVIDQCTDRTGSYGSKYYTYWTGYLMGSYTQYPPYIPTLWNYGLTTANGCASTGGINGYLNAWPVCQMEVCTGQPATVDFSVPPLVTLPASLPLTYTISHPTGAFNATVTIRFYTPTGTLVYTQALVVAIAANTVNGTVNVNTSALAPGFYRVEVTFNVLNPCGALSDLVMNKAFMALNPGQTPCLVWPGDANNDGIVNFGDRKALNDYVKNANLNPVWLQGPARYRADASTNPLTYYSWEAQPSVPWQTPEGCYMDCDGNGVINNFDYLPIKLNWFKVHTTPKSSSAGLAPLSFDMTQNYPNPFNSGTSIEFTAPEASQVTIIVTDMLGRTVATLFNGVIPAGSNNVTFNASTLNSGNYVATIMATGNETGTTFSKSIKMTLKK